MVSSSSHITLQPKTGCPLKLSRAELVSTWMGDSVKTRFAVGRDVSEASRGCSPFGLWGLTPQCSDGDTILSIAPSFG